MCCASKWLLGDDGANVDSSHCQETQDKIGDCCLILSFDFLVLLIANA